MGVFYRIGLAIGFWEPMAITDITRSPFCLVNMGGIKLDIGKVGLGVGAQENNDVPNVFYHVHWYKYQLIAYSALFDQPGT